MHALHPQPAALITAGAREEACRLNDEEQNEEEQNEEEQPEEHHRIEPPEAKLLQPPPEIELEQHVEARKADEQHGDACLRSEAALDEFEDGGRIACAARSQSGQNHRGVERGPADPPDHGKYVGLCVAGALGRSMRAS